MFPMLRTTLLLLAAVLLMLCISSCEPDTVPFLTYCSIQGDGTLFDKDDNSLAVGSWSRAFYLSDDTVFYLGSSLVRRNLITNQTQYLTPPELAITDKRYLAIDKHLAILYFSANNAIYQVGFNGENLSRLSPEDGYGYSAPAISALGQRLTAIRNKRIMSYDTQTEDWSELPSPVSACYAVYLEDSGEYYYYSSQEQGYWTVISLCKTNGTEADSTFLMKREYSDFNKNWLNLRVCHNQRWFGIHNMLEPEVQYDMWGGSQWYRYSSDLLVYDRITGTTTTIDDCYSYAFVHNTGELLYSHYQHGMADVRKMNLNSGLSTLIWDGYYCKDNYFFSMSEIYPRADGHKIYLRTWVKALR